MDILDANDDPSERGIQEALAKKLAEPRIVWFSDIEHERSDRSHPVMQ